MPASRCERLDFIVDDRRNRRFHLVSKLLPPTPNLSRRFYYFSQFTYNRVFPICPPTILFSRRCTPLKQSFFAPVASLSLVSSLPPSPRR